MCKLLFSIYIFFFKQKTAYEMRISDWSSDVCSSDLKVLEEVRAVAFAQRLEAAQVADRRVQPDVQELARVAGDLEAEVGRVARDVPGAQAAFAVQPLLQLGLDPGHGDRSEEHTSELQSLMRISYAVFCWKKKTLLT